MIHAGRDSILDFTSIVAVTTIAFGIMRSINKHLDRKWRAQQEEMQTRLDGSDELRDRVAELEERVDFAERILAEGKRPDELRASSS